jgi:ribosomal protein S18 acetylase RimI-like enzyme
VPPEYTIRAARRDDIATLVDFTIAEAREAEGKAPGRDAIQRGVEGAFADPPHATYWIAETQDGDVVASASALREWSNFHGAHYWWVQSLFILPEHRGHGLVEKLLDHLAAQARQAGALDLRLYAHSANERALAAYRRCGFTVAPYAIMSKSLGPA